ncbi:MAG TPA: lipid A-modifier LpxR family protein [Bacteroidales bacterium]
MKTAAILFILLFFHTYQITGQISSETRENEPKLIFDLNVANDMTFFTDQYFTSGIQFRVYAPFMAKSPFSKILVHAGKNAVNYYALTLTQNIYTPIYNDTLILQEIPYPFASYLLFGNRLESYNPQHRLKVTSEIQLGVIGSLAGGEIFQNTLHNNIAIADPVEGWENQISNDLCIQYSALLEKGVIGARWLELNVYGGAILGVPHTEAQVGMYARFGFFNDYFQNIGISKNRKWQAWLFCAGDVNLVAYNAVLEGGLFNESPYYLQTINPVIWHTRFGGTLVYKTIKLEIAQEVISPSYPTAYWFRWAYASLMVGF